MAAFDVPVPQQNDPLYLHFSHPIQDLEPDKSKAIAIKGLGDAADAAVKGVDQTLKTHAEYLGEQLGESEQTDFLNAVKTVDSLTKGPQANVPGAVKQGLSDIQNIQQGYEQGHLRETEYYKNLYEKSKSLRAQWAPYRDYIDKGVEKATGITPNANQYIKSLLADINERVTKTDKVTQEIISQATKMGLEGAPGLLDMVKAHQEGKVNQWDVAAAANKANALKYQSTVAQDQLHISEAGDKINQSGATKVIDNDVPARYSQMLDGMTVRIGMNNEKVSDLLAATARGERPNITDDEFAQLGMYENQRYMALRSQIEAEHNKIDPRSGQSLRTMAGDKYKSTVDQAFDQHTMFQQAIKDKDLGAMWRQKNAVEAQLNGGVWKALQTDDLRPMLQMQHALTKTGGPNIWSYISGTALGKGALTLPDQNSINALAENLATKSNFQGIDSNKKTIEAAVNEKGPDGRPNPAAVNATVQIVPTLLTRPDLPDPAKWNVATRSFNPSNDGWLKNIQMDYTTEDGRKVAGRYAAYSYYGTPEVAKEIKRLTNQYGMNVWEDYKGWMETSFGRDLFSEDLTKLRDLQKKPNFEIQFNQPTNGNAPSFDIKQHYRSGRSQVGGPLADVQDYRIKEVLDRINDGIKGLHNVYSQDGDQSVVKARLMQMLQANGINPNEGNSVARDMLISIGATKKPEPIKDQSKFEKPALFGERFNASYGNQ